MQFLISSNYNNISIRPPF